jgi:ankyrin repeat protein/catechol 2,3-dioxygenase-like lactoylglutathione lyase family enzyme
MSPKGGDRSSAIEAFFTACRSGDIAALRDLLERDRSLVTERMESGATGLHVAVRHPDALRLLLEYGADPNVREKGDNALPLHFAAGGGPLESVRALLDASSDVHGVGDAHRLDVIGWATVFADARRDVVQLLVDRGAKHHIFSAVALGDLDLVRRVVAEDPSALARRLAPTEQEQTALHYVVAPPDGLVGGTFRTGNHYRTLALLIELGADLEARDAKGRMPLEVAMLLGDQQAMRLLHSAGARLPAIPARVPGTTKDLTTSIARLSPMVGVADMQRTLDWYRAIGFELTGSHGDDGTIDWACVTFGETEIMFVPSSDETKGTSLWIRTTRLDDLYAHLKQRQLAWAAAVLAGEPTDAPEVRFTGDLYTAFYGQREFSLRDPNGVEVYFYQPLE